MPMTGEDDTDDLPRRLAELREAVRARDDFIAVAAHELRNPMTPILNQVELLLAAARRGQCQPGMLAGLERLEANVQRFMRRATTLLDVSRANSGPMRLEPARFDLSGLIQQAVRQYASAAKRSGCDLVLDLPPEVVGTWDRLAVEQVFDNLLSNAVKFGAGQPIEIGLTADASGIAFFVEDHGVGMSEADRQRVFGRFEQAAGQRRHGGFGIGLWLANSLVRAMDGTIAVTSRSGEGTRFTVRLPWAMPAGADDDDSP